MKVGIRKPNIKKSIKARTTGKIKRSIKKSVNPLYGKKGMGYITDPKKAVYNKVYNKTTVGVKDIVSSDNTKKINVSANVAPNKTNKALAIISLIFGSLFLLISLISFPVGGFIFLIPSLFLIYIGKGLLKK